MSDPGYLLWDSPQNVFNICQKTYYLALSHFWTSLDLSSLTSCDNNNWNNNWIIITGMQMICAKVIINSSLVVLSFPSFLNHYGIQNTCTTFCWRILPRCIGWRPGWWSHRLCFSFLGLITIETKWLHKYLSTLYRPARILLNDKLPFPWRIILSSYKGIRKHKKITHQFIAKLSFSSIKFY